MIAIQFLLGIFLGMLVNLLADSLPFYRRVEGFHCAHCGAPRAVLAWSGISAGLSGRRRCENCATSLSPRTLFIEMVLGIGAVVIGIGAPNASAYLVQMLVFSIFLLITVIDIEHRLILHIVSGPAALIIALIGILDPMRGPEKTLLGGLAGFGSFLLLYYLGQVFASFMSRRRGETIDEVAFGFGDVTLAGVIGLTVGWPGVIVALVLGILAAGFFSLLFIVGMLVRRQYNPFMPIPYGPFLILGSLFVYFGGVGLVVV